MNLKQFGTEEEAKAISASQFVNQMIGKGTPSASQATRICLDALSASMAQAHNAQSCWGRLHSGLGPAPTPFCGGPSFAAASFV
jgi:hypothetical protein